MDHWFTSDTHWGHANIIKYSNRPFADVTDMNHKMVQEWNKLVKPVDIVHHLGDFAFMKFSEFKSLIWSLSGNIEGVFGNHDKMVILNQNELLKQGKITSLQYYQELKIPGCPMICLFHYGQRVWNKSHHGSIMLYGHSHGSLPPFGKSVDVGVDCKEITTEYRPIHLDEILAYMSKRDFKAADHHGMDDKDE